jgi:hypothetical protein
MSARTLFELHGLADRRYSQFSWRTRLALAHKGLDVDYRPVQVSDKAAIVQRPGQGPDPRGRRRVGHRGFLAHRRTP